VKNKIFRRIRGKSSPAETAEMLKLILESLATVLESLAELQREKNKQLMAKNVDLRQHTEEVQQRQLTRQIIEYIQEGNSLQ
jgi:Na+/phosphate symporter